MKKVLLLIGAAMLVFAIASCTSFQMSELTVNREAPSYEVVGNFDITVSVTELLGASAGNNLANITATDMDEPIKAAIQKEIARQDGDAAVDVTITYEATFVDMLLNSLTAYIYSPAHAHIQGKIVKY